MLLFDFCGCGQQQAGDGKVPAEGVSRHCES